MRKKIFALLVVFSFLNITGFSSLFLLTTASPNDFPDYIPVDLNSGLAGEIVMPVLSGDMGSYGAYYDFEDTPPVGTTVVDWYLEALTGDPSLTLRWAEGNVEIWVQDDMSFPDGDPRNVDPYNLMISDEMFEHLADEFNDNIYPKCTEFFGIPFDRDGTNTAFEYYGFPPEYYNWTVATDNPQRTILKILNYRDDNYYDPTYPYYVVGFFNPTYDSYYNRNMIHIDPWAYWQRLGPEGTVWFPERPDLVNTRPYVYESTVAHEYQHLIHADYQPDDDLFMNEGCSTFAELVCGYPVDYNSINSFFATPDNSLTQWGDQTDINILADYGQVQLFCTYLNDHYSTDTVQFLSAFVASGIPGIGGVNAALAALGHSVDFEDVFHDWKLANLIRSGCGKYNYKSIDLSLADPVNELEMLGDKIPWTSAADQFGTTSTILGYDTGVSLVGAYGTEYIHLSELKNGINFILFDGDEQPSDPTTWIEGDGYWYSGAEDLINILIATEVYVDPADPTLELTTYWDIEDYWDFGFVQVSPDGGEWDSTWISLENEYTTYDHDPDAHPDVVANLPGLTSWSGFITPDGIVTMTFDLSAYAGQTIDLGFRYVTDWGTLYEGWYIFSAVVSGVECVPALEPVIPSIPVRFQVTVVERRTHKYGMITYHIDDMFVVEELGNLGIDLILKSKHEDIILVVSPMMESGFCDYKFKASKLCF
ncbi:MAG: hypothetical protein ACFFA0_13835 [Promethearchaeota archaeon]